MPAPQDANPSAWPAVLDKLVRHVDLEPAEIAAAFSTILRGEATDAQIAAFAVALRTKGETAVEIAALVQTMLSFAERIDTLGPLVDTCGTGGDRAGTINVSTMAALVAAGAGARVAKHGNRAASSDCGSADVFEALGVEIELGPQGVTRCINEAGIGFCFARRFHPGLRFAGPVRSEIGVATTFNFLGPLANPAGATRRVIGVSDPSMAEKMIAVLGLLGVEHAMVFYGHDGLDELTTTTTSTVFELQHGELRSYEVDPATFGIPAAVRDDLAGGDAATNAAVVKRVLDGAPGAARDIVVLNAAAALVVAGLASDLAAGAELARTVLDDGRAASSLDALVRVSNSAKADEG
jgi:anthranilate phosphoribosyltransferase